jgi:hypothetical protein
VAENAEPRFSTRERDWAGLNADLGGWKTVQTVLTCYLQPDEEAQRLALSDRRRIGP